MQKKLVILAFSFLLSSTLISSVYGATVTVPANAIFQTTGSTVTLGTSLVADLTGGWQPISGNTLTINSTVWGIYPASSASITLSQLDLSDGTIDFTATGNPDTIHNFSWDVSNAYLEEASGQIGRISTVTGYSASAQSYTMTFVATGSFTVEVNCTTLGEPEQVTDDDISITYNYYSATKICQFTPSGNSDVVISWASLAQPTTGNEGVVAAMLLLLLIGLPAVAMLMFLSRR